MAAALLGVALAVACATPPPSSDDTAAARSAYDQALSRSAGDPAAAREALGAFIEAYPRSPQADDAGLRLARLALDAGDAAAAERELRRVLDRHPSGDASDAARLELAGLLLAAGRVDEAAQVAGRMRMSLLSAADRRAAHRLLADLAGAQASPATQLRWLGRVRADQTTPEGAAALDAEIDAVIAAVDASELEALAARLGKRVPAARVHARMADVAFAEGRVEDALDQLAIASRLPLTPAGALAIRKVEARVERGPAPGADFEPGALTPLGLDPSGAQAVIGAVLPLSGPYAAFGRETLQGITLALGLFGAQGPSDSGIQLDIRDSRGDPQRAAAATAELAAQPGLLGIIGPLVGRAAEAAAKVAAEREVPLLTLTRREDVARLGESVLKLGGSAAAEAERLADYAFEQLEARRFALLYPDNAYGHRLRAMFWDAVEARGGEVAAVARYEVGATDFAAPIRRLIGYELLSPEVREVLAERGKLLKRAKRLPPEAATELRREAYSMLGPDETELPPTLDFDALFLPDGHEMVSLIGPHLAFHDVRGVRLLGTSGWNHPDLLEIGGRHLDGAVFAANFFGGSEAPHVAAFQQDFVASFGEEPGFLAAQAFDAASLVLSAVLDGAAVPDDLLAHLLASREIAGTTGALLGFDAEGNLQRRAQILGVEGARVVSVDERGGEPPLLPLPPVRPWELEEEEGALGVGASIGSE